ncbi:hypothetical protein [Nocardia thailandica]
MAERQSTVNVPRALLERARKAVLIVREAGNPSYSMARFTREAFAAKIAEIERVYNAGRAIVGESRPLKAGRPTNE